MFLKRFGLHIELNLKDEYCLNVACSLSDM